MCVYVCVFVCGSVFMCIHPPIGEYVYLCGYMFIFYTYVLILIN